jgi:hypothetical protein
LKVPAATTWTYKIIAFVVLVVIVGALFPTLTDALADYAANETTFGPVLETIVPLLIGVGILLVGVAMFLGGMRGRDY